MKDVTNKIKTLPTDILKDMKQRYEKFIQENKREPKYIKINEEEYITTQKFKEILKKIPLAPDTNIENTDTTITAQEFKDAIKRYEEFKKTNNREPKIIYLRPSEYVPLQKFKEMKQRWDLFIATYQREPKTIKVKKDFNYFRVVTFIAEKQDTGYTCGPSSLAMLLRELSDGTLKITEEELAQKAGTTKKGTSHEGLFKAAKQIAKQLNWEIECTDKKLSQITYRELGEMIADPRIGVIAHIRTKGFKIWNNQDFGHYVFPVALDLDKKIITIADPARSKPTTYDVTFKEFEDACKAVTYANSIIIIRRKK